MFAFEDSFDCSAPATIVLVVEKHPGIVDVGRDLDVSILVRFGWRRLRLGILRKLFSGRQFASFHRYTEYGLITLPVPE